MAAGPHPRGLTRDCARSSAFGFVRRGRRCDAVVLATTIDLMPTSLLLAAVTVLSATLKFDAPSGWVAKTPSSTMRVADFVLPKVATDSEDATLTLYFFGASQGGGVS